MSQVRVVVAPDEVEPVSDHLWAAGTLGIEERDHPDGVLLLAGFEDEASATAAAATLDRPAEVAPILDDGLDAWREHAKVLRAGPFVLVPAWLPEPTVLPGSIVLTLDPGRAFGSGSHATTRLVLAALPDLVGGAEQVLDVGCGSGVLSIAAAALGAGGVVGVDVDPEAVVATEANAARNGVADHVEASTRPLSQAGGPFDLVLANLLAPTIRELAPDLRRCTRPGGTLVLSGLLADRWPETTTTAFDDWVVRGVREDDGWVAVVLRRTS